MESPAFLWAPSVHVGRPRPGKAIVPACRDPSASPIRSVVPISMWHQSPGMERGLPGLSSAVLVLSLPLRSMKGAMYSNQLDPMPWYTDEAALWGFKALLHPAPLGLSSSSQTCRQRGGRGGLK